jgi:hypothetical protein
MTNKLETSIVAVACIVCVYNESHDVHTKAILPKFNLFVIFL